MISRFSRYVPSSVHELGLEPFYSSGDGICFYNLLSILMCGHEHESEIYRLGAALYGLGHYEHIVEAVRIYMYLTDVDVILYNIYGGIFARAPILIPEGSASFRYLALTVM